MKRIFTLLTLFAALSGHAQIQQGPNVADVPGTASKADAQVGWTSANSAAIANGTFARVTVSRSTFTNNRYSNFLQLEDYDFSLPASAVVTGIQVSITQRYFGTNGVTGSLRLVKNGAITTNAKTYFGTYTGASAGSFGTTTYGGSKDLWGGTWTKADVEDIDFGIAFEVQKPNNNNNESFTVDVDAIQISVFYTLPITVSNLNFPSPLLTATVQGDLTGTDPNEGTLTAAIIAQPAVGTVALQANGIFTYTPPALAIFRGGPVTFTYNVTSSAGVTSNTATVTVVYPENTALPVTFISLDARKATNATQVTWKVGTENNVKLYEVERSVNGGSFTRVGYVTATGASSYSFNDGQPTEGTVLYRVKNVDFDGRFKYSSTINFKNGSTSVAFKAFPLPAQNSLTVQHTTTSDNAQINIVSMEGRVLRTINLPLSATQTDVNLSGLKSGMYLLRFVSGKGNVETMKIIKQ